MSARAHSAGGSPPGTRMGRYELLHRLAMGGMAELYVARHSGPQGFERTVVVKRILPHLTEDPEFIAMFLDEARIAASLDHPNVAQVTDIDTEHGEYFLAMEYVHGRNLREVLRAAPQGLPLGIALPVLAGVSAGLHHAHEALGSDGWPLGLVHRDVSPSNVMIAYSGAVKLTDFGIAKAALRTSKTLAGRIKGKVGYMSPEQCRGEEVDRRSDIFSLGILAYETLTGARAFYAPNEYAAMARTARGDYTPPTELRDDFPPALARIIERALCTDPDARYPTALAMQLDIEAFAEADGRTLSSIELAAFMRETFGAPPHPQTLSVPRPVLVEPVSTASRSTRISAVRSGMSRGRFWFTLAATATLAAGVAVVVGQRIWAQPSDAEVRESPAVAEERGSQADEAPAAPSAAVSVTAPPVTSPAAGAVPTDAVAPAPVPTPASDPAPVAAPTKRQRVKAAKRPGKRPVRRSPYPPGYER